MAASDFNIICVTNRHLCNGNFLEKVEKVAAGGVNAVILREKDLTEKEYGILAEEFVKICRKNGVGAILHTYVDAAIELGAGEIHLPLDAMKELDNKKRNKFNKIGVSCHSLQDVLLAVELGAEYVTFGHVFETDCKRNLAPRGLEALKNVCGNVKIPVYAIGGINAGNINSVRDAGAAGACIMSGFMQCENPKNFVHRLINFNGGKNA